MNAIKKDGGFWVFCALPAECYDRQFPLSDIFPNPKAAKAECARRNLAIVEGKDLADEVMTGLHSATYRQFYEWTIERWAT